MGRSLANKHFKSRCHSSCQFAAHTSFPSSTATRSNQREYPVASSPTRGSVSHYSFSQSQRYAMADDY
jgi:hypothetical protein